MRLLPFLLALLPLSSCLIQFEYGDHYEEAVNAGHVERYVKPFDAAVLQSYLAGNYERPDSFSMMEVNSKQLKRACSGKYVWLNVFAPYCPVVYKDCGVVKTANSLTDSSDVPLLMISTTYQAILAKDIQDSLSFQAPILVVSNAEYGEKNRVRKRSWQHMFEELIEKKYPKDCNQLLLRANGSCACLTYDGEFKEIE